MVNEVNARFNSAFRIARGCLHAATSLLRCILAIGGRGAETALSIVSVPVRWLRLLASPLAVLWPWLIGNLALWLLLSSAQGTSVASETNYEGVGGLVVALSIASIAVLTALASLFALLSRKKMEREPPGSVGNRLEILIAGGWITALSTGFGFQLALATNSVAAWLAESRCIRHAFFYGLPSLARARVRPTHWMLSFVARHSIFFFAIASGIASTAPLVLGGAMVRSTPAALSDLGPLLIATLGFAALATLFGAVLVTIPLCLKARWVGAAFLVVMFIVRHPSRWQWIMKTRCLKRSGSSALVERSTTRAEPCKRQPRTIAAAMTAKSTPKATPSDPKPKDRIVHLVSAEGGGIRAAYWAAVSLAYFDVGTDDKFAETVGTLSGVSGGSLASLRGLRLVSEPTYRPQKGLI